MKFVMTPQRSEQIQKRISEMQSGKSGIYPYRVAQDIAAEFFIPYEAARDEVLAHIRNV